MRARLHSFFGWAVRNTPAPVAHALDRLAVRYLEHRYVHRHARKPGWVGASTTGGDA